MQRIIAKNQLPLAGIAQWVGHCPANQKVAGLIPSQAHAWIPGWGPANRYFSHTSKAIFLPSLSINKTFKKIN